MRTTAVLEGDEYMLNGGKRFITNAGVAQVYVVFAETEQGVGHKGISAFIVPADAPGFTVGKYEKKMGIKGSTTGELFFDDCRIPAENILGEPGTGFTLAMQVLDRSRPGVATQAWASRVARSSTPASTCSEARAVRQADRTPAGPGAVDARRHGDAGPLRRASCCTAPVT